jgi:hypothetical protein
MVDIIDIHNSQRWHCWNWMIKIYQPKWHKMAHFFQEPIDGRLRSFGIQEGCCASFTLLPPIIT